MSRHVAIVGGGYSGTLQAINLLRHSDCSVTLIERGPAPGRGLAYSTPHADHLLNVRAERMSAFADEDGHFADWLARRGEGGPNSFAQRRLYGTYLEELLGGGTAEAGDRLHVVNGDAIAVTRSEQGEIVQLRDGDQIAADAAILSVGNLPPETPRGVSADLAADVYVADPWASDLAAGLTSDDTVLLIGTGLTAIDAALMLDTAGFKGKVVALSRRGLVPRAHDRTPPHPPALDRRPDTQCSPLLRFVRRQSEKVGWPEAVDQLRHQTQPLWQAASFEERRRFLRHLRPWWDVHRHRIAPAIAARIAAMQAEGRLSFQAGKLVEAAPEAGGVSVRWRPRGSDVIETLPVRRIVNCTGPQGDLARSDEPLLAQLLDEGRIRADPCRIGIDVDAGCRTIDKKGETSPSLFAIGPMTRGAFWEIVAVPDLRVQVDALARTF